MAVGANSYGAGTDVAALTPRFTNAGTYDGTTRPTLTQVEGWIDQVSSILNVLLAEQSFSIPVSQSDVKLMLKTFVATEVADLCNYANSAGRFFQNQQFTTGPWQAIQKEAADFIAAHANGIEALGATRTHAGLKGLAWRDTEDNGETLSPQFDFGKFDPN